MDKLMLFKLGATALLILVYVVVAALDLNREIVAPIIVIAIAAVLFLPFKRNKPKAKTKN